MYFKNILDVFKYPKLKNVLKYYIWRHPSLVFAGYDQFSNYYFSKKLEDFTGDKLVFSSQLFLPGKFVDHLSNKGFKEFDGFRLLLYALVRKYKPEIVIETGVAAGASTAFILSAMHQNNKGTLYSIDLPINKHIDKDIHTLEDGTQYDKNLNIGYLIPNYLKYRWNLIKGDSKKELPILLKELDNCSMFFHDSLHTYDHMMMEYTTSWPFIEKGGFLLSHDVVWNNAFIDFTKKVNKKSVIYNSLGLVQK